MSGVGRGQSRNFVRYGKPGPGLVRRALVLLRVGLSTCHITHGDQNNFVLLWLWKRYQLL